MTRSWFAIVLIDFTNQTDCTWRTRATESANQIVTRSTILTRIRLAVVDVKFTVLALEALFANALVRAD